MGSTRKFTRQLGTLLIAILVWISVGSAAFSFVVGHVIPGLIKALVALALLVIALKGRIYRKLDGRDIPTLSLLVLLLTVLLLVSFEVSQLRFGVSAFGGAETLPGLIRVGRAVGSFLLAAALAVEAIRLVVRRT